MAKRTTKPRVAPTRRRKRGERNVLSVNLSNKKVTEKRMRLMWISLLVLSSCLLVGYGVQIGYTTFLQKAFYQNSEFQIQNVEVSIQGNLSKADVIRWSGIQAGTNLMGLNLEKHRNTLLMVPYIQDAQLERHLPSTLRISVVERQPVAIIKPKVREGYMAAQSVYYIDRNGIVMKPKPGEKILRLPVLTGVSLDDIVEGEALELPEVQSAIEFIRLTQVNPIGVILDLRQIDVSIPDYLHTRTNDRGFIRFHCDDLDAQLDRLEVIFNWARENKKLVRTVDLSPRRNVPVTFF